MLDLDEQNEEKLLNEIQGRLQDQANGICDYCHRSPRTNSCKEYKRHEAPVDPTLAKKKLEALIAMRNMT